MSTENIKTIIEPFRIKMIEPIPLLSREERSSTLINAHYNPFLLNADTVTIDLMTDSGTGAMSSNQWSAIMLGDESYAGSSSWERVWSSIFEVTGFRHIFPVHQGRAAERILMKTLLKPGQVVLSNTHFDTTRANVEAAGAEAIDLPIDANACDGEGYNFGGNMDLDMFESALLDFNGQVGLVLLTLTNNAIGGQPVSMGNIRRVSQRCKEEGIPFFLDAARFAENAWFIHCYDPDWKDATIPDIVREMFKYADGFTFSAKKDAIVNIGGILATRIKKLVEPIKNELICTEGFPTYGGLAGRDLEAIAVGIKEAMQIDYLRYRAQTIRYFADGLERAGAPVIRPTGGHAVYIDAGKWLNHIPPDQFPGQVLANAFYLEGGIRGVEIGRLMFPQTDRQLLRLALPRRVYTQAHVDYVVEVAEFINTIKTTLKGLRIVKAPSVLRHFSAQLIPIDERTASTSN